MCNKYCLITAMIILSTYVLTLPVLASDVRFEYSADYDVKGKVDFERVIGHECYTGAEKTQTIKGYGEYTKTDDLKMSHNIISHKDTIDWEVPADAIDGLEVLTSIDLCAKPLSTADHNYVKDEELLRAPDKAVVAENTAFEAVYENAEEGDIYVDPKGRLLAFEGAWGDHSSLEEMYHAGNASGLIEAKNAGKNRVLAWNEPAEIDYPCYYDCIIDAALDDGILKTTPINDYIEYIEQRLDEDEAQWIYEQYGLQEGDIINPYHPWVVEGDVEVSPKTEQVWGTRIETEPGHSGAYHDEFIAAYGPGPSDEARKANAWRFDKNRDDFTTLAWGYGEEKKVGLDYGDHYVGNYFEIDHYALTTGGKMDRIISISEPFEHRFLEELYSVTGMSEVADEFSLEVKPPGPEAVTFEWYDLF